MPPNLGGFFMVRSYYPSECHADYFDFERIEALKPAIEACGISTLSQSPMLGFHKQMDNRIKLLRSEERRVDLGGGRRLKKKKNNTSKMRVTRNTTSTNDMSTDSLYSCVTRCTRNE